MNPFQRLVAHLLPLGLSLALGVLAGCSSEEASSFEFVQATRLAVPSARPTNVLLVTLAATRADRIGAYGDGAAATPTLDKLALDGTIFQNCQSTSPDPRSAAASVLSATYPFEHGVRTSGMHLFDSSKQTLVSTMKESGLMTLGVSGHRSLGYDSGLAHEFDYFDGDLSGGVRDHGMIFEQTDASSTIRRATQALDQTEERPWFLWVHLHDPGSPYQAPASFRGKGGDSYGEDLAYTDYELNSLLLDLEARGQRENTLVVVCGLAGELLELGLDFSRHLRLRDETLRVPLIFQHASVGGGAVVPGVVSVIDVAPTIADLLGTSYPSSDGRVLTESLRDASRFDAERWVYSESLMPLHEFGLAPIHSVRSSEVRLVDAPRPEFFELARDPGELSSKPRSPLVATSGATEKMAEFLARPSMDLRAKTLNLYSASERMDPKVAFEKIVRASQLAAQINGQLTEEQSGGLSGVLTALPAWSLPREHLVIDARSRGDNEKALELMEGYVLYGAARASNLVRLAELERSLGKPESEWNKRLLLADHLEPTSIAATLFRVRVARQAGDLDGAGAALAKSIGFRPYDALLLAELGAIHLEQGRTESARELAVRAQGVARSWPRGFELEAQAFEAEKRPDAAFQAIVKGLSQIPRSAELTALAARAEWAAGKREESRRRLSRAVGEQPTNVGLLQELSNQMMATNDWKDAVAHLRKITELRPADVQARQILLRALLVVGDEEAAYDTATWVLEGNPDHYVSLTFLALQAEKAADAELAAEYFVRARTAHPKKVAQELERNPALEAIRARVDG